jgi:hypothetical protein
VEDMALRDGDISPAEEALNKALKRPWAGAAKGQIERVRRLAKSALKLIGH